MGIIGFLNAYAQEKSYQVYFNKLTKVLGTEYVIASIRNDYKVFKKSENYLVFINTQTTEKTRVDFPEDSNIREVQQIKIDSLGINRILVAGKIFDLNMKNGIDWDDPIQIIILSTDGKEKIQLTDTNFFTRNWVVDEFTGSLVVTGYSDSNDNKRYDNRDKSEIRIYDLKTLQMKGKL